MAFAPIRVRGSPACAVSFATTSMIRRHAGAMVELKAGPVGIACWAEVSAAGLATTAGPAGTLVR